MNYKIICSGRIFKAVSFTIILALLLTFTVPQTSYAGQISHGAKDDEEVTIIVELDNKPLISQYRTLGESQSFDTFANSAKGRQTANAVLAAQNKAVKSAEMITGNEIESRYKNVMSGFSIKAKKSDLTKIKNLPGVKTAFIERIWYSVKPVSEIIPMVNHSGPYIGSTYAKDMVMTEAAVRSQ